MRSHATDAVAGTHQEVRRRPVRGDELTPVAAEALHLQRAAGNRAVQRALGPESGVVQRDKAFDDATAKDLGEAAAPMEIELPKALEDGLADAWSKSMPEGKSQEHAGILVKDKDGKYVWKAKKEAGESGSTTLNLEDVGKDETLIATAHTHPYDKDEGGFERVAFSGGDLGNLLAEDVRRMTVVRAAKAEFVATKTKEFDAMVKDFDAAKKEAMRDDAAKVWQAAFDGAPDKADFEAKVQLGVEAVCKKYHLAYYKGDTGKKLKRVVLNPAPGKAAEAAGAAGGAGKK